MFDQQYGDAHIPNPGNQAADLGGLVNIQTCRRFIKKQQFRLRGQGPCQLHRPLLTKGEAGGLDIGKLFNCKQAKQLHGFFSNLPFFFPGGGGVQHAGQEPCPTADMPADHDRFQGGHAVKKVNILKGTRHTQSSDCMWFQPLDLPTLKEDTTRRDV